MSLGAFAQGFAGGMNMGRQWKKWNEEDQLKKLQAEEFGKVGQAANYGEAMGLAEGQQAEMLKAQDAEFGDAGYKATAEGLNSVSADATPADPTKMRAVTERDATEGYLRRAQAKGLMTPMEAMKMRGEAMDYEGKRLGLKAAQRADESQDRQAKYAAEAAKGLEMIDSGPENALRYGIQMFNSDQGRWGQGEFKGVRVTGAVREDGNIVLYDEKDGTKNMVISPAKLRTEVRRAHMEKVALENPQVAMQLLDRDLRKAEKAGDREHAVEVLRLGHELGMIKQEAYLKGLERVSGKGSGGGAAGDSAVIAGTTKEGVPVYQIKGKIGTFVADEKGNPVQYTGPLYNKSGAGSGKGESFTKAPDWAQKRLYELENAIAAEGNPIFFDGDKKKLVAERDRLLNLLNQTEGTNFQTHAQVGVARQDAELKNALSATGGGNQGGAKPQSQGLRGGVGIPASEDNRPLGYRIYDGLRLAVPGNDIARDRLEEFRRRELGG